MVIYDTEFWRKVIDFDYLVEMGTVSKNDLDFFYFAESTDDAFNYLTRELTRGHLQGRNF